MPGKDGPMPNQTITATEVQLRPTPTAAEAIAITADVVTVQLEPNKADATQAMATDGVTVQLEPKSVVEVDHPLKAEAPVGLRSLFRYADRVDALLLGTGLVAIVISGANQPLQLLVFGRLLDSFNDLDTDEAVEKINFFAACYAALGVQQMVTQSLQSACLSASAARQSKRIRSLYFSSLARAPMAHADAHDYGALASGVLESTTVMAAGMGDELAKIGQTLLAFAIGLSVALALSWRLAVRSTSAIERFELASSPFCNRDSCSFPPRWH